MKPLIAIVGKSGSGKNYIANKLERRGYTSVKSYTTRPVRPNDESDINTHTFISPDRVSDYIGDIVADTYFNGAYYFATRQQLNNADIYILDKDGLKQLLRNYYDREVLSFYIDCDSSICAERMSKRGDSDEAIMSRLQYDAKAFEDADEFCDFIYSNETQDDANSIVDIIISVAEHYNKKRCKKND